MPKDLEQQNKNLNKIITVRFSQSEYENLKHFADIGNLQISKYLRKNALSYEVKSIYDEKTLLELMRMRGNFNQVGNLFKTYLDSNDKKFNQEQLKYILNEFEKSHDEINEFLKVLESKIK